MKKRKKSRAEVKPYRFPFAITRRGVAYLFAPIGALIFTQALKNQVSAVLYIFVLLLPAADIIYLLVSLLCVKADFSCDCAQTEKNIPVGYTLRLSNRSPLPYPFIECELVLPEETEDGGASLSCESSRVRISLSPFSRRDTHGTALFPYKGAHKMGIHAVYAFSLMSMFRLRVAANRYDELVVLPRSSQLDIDTSSPGARHNAPLLQTEGNDTAEITDIREYRAGDYMKSVHWKLSSKVQDLMVKKHAADDRDTTYVFSDFTTLYTVRDGCARDINEYAADCVAQASLFFCENAIDGGGRCELIYTDGGEEYSTVRIRAQSRGELDRALHMYAAARATMPGFDFTSNDTEHSGDGTTRRIFVTAGITPEATERICSRSRAGKVTVCITPPYSKLNNHTDLREDVGRCADHMRTSGAEVYIIEK